MIVNGFLAIIVTVLATVFSMPIQATSPVPKMPPIGNTPEGEKAKPPKGEEVVQEIEAVLRSVASCDPTSPQRKRVSKLQNNIKKLKVIITEHQDSYDLGIKNEMVVLGLKYVMPENILSPTDKMDSIEIQKYTANLKFEMEFKYLRYYNLPEETKRRDYPDEWAKQLHQGLVCAASVS